MSVDKLLSVLDASEPLKKTKDIRDIKKENSDTKKILEDIETPFESKNKTIRDMKSENYDADKILRDIRTLYESGEKYHNKPMRTGNACSSNYIEYESNGDKDKMPLIEDYLDKIKPYLNDLIDKHKTQGKWKTQLTMAINFIFSKDSDETHTVQT